MNSGVTAYLTLRDGAILHPPALPGADLCRALSDALDLDLSALLPPDSPLALLATGGYGRRELCLHSDIDVMLLYDGPVPSAAVDAVLYPLWDAGLKVGHAVRTPPEAMRAASDNLATLTSLLDMRLIAGSRGLPERLWRDLARMLRRRPEQLQTELRRAEEARRGAEPYQLLEANLKEGRGGLRALHGRHWVRAAAGLLDGIETPAQTEQITAAHDLLLRTRNALHAVAGRAQDTWVFDLQGVASAWLGSDVDGCGTSLYNALRVVDRTVAAAWAAGVVEPMPAPVRGRLRSIFGVRTGDGPGNTVLPEALPELRSGRSVFEYVGALARQGIRFIPTPAVPAVSAAAGPSWGAADRDGLLALLRAGERGRALFEALDELGFLERALPEWRHVRAAPQHAPFHLHPVDVHLWRTVLEALSLAEGRSDEPWTREVADDLGGLDELLLAALLHDIGKGWPGDHAETGAAAAMAFARRAHFPADFMLTVTGAIRHHLLLPIVATRRDIADARVVEDVANRVGRVHTLRVLYLLSVADSRATSPTVWGPWKGTLVRSLFAAALAVLEARSGATPLSIAPPDLRARALEAAARSAEPAAVSDHIDGMAPGYLRSFSAEDVVRHALVSSPSPSAGMVRLDVRDDGDIVDLLFVAADRPGLIALVSGVLALHNLSVLGGRYFTRADGTALQALHVVDALGNPIAAERWRRVTRDLELGLAGDLPLEQQLGEKVRAYRRQPAAAALPEVRLIDDASEVYTVVEVHAADRVGLLHDLAAALFALQLDIHLAKIDTQGTRVVDVFYLRDLHGRAVDDAERLAALRVRLLNAAGEGRT